MLANITLARPLVILDLETTGTRTDQDRIVEISLRKLCPANGAEQKTMRLNPGVPIPPEVSEIHGITDADVADKPTFRKVARSLRDYLDGCDFAGFNILAFDIKMLVAEFRRAEVTFNPVGRYYIDCKNLFHKFEPRDLSAALRFYCGRDHEGAHGAEADVLATRDILDAQVLRYADLPRTVAELHEALRDPKAVDFHGNFVRRADGEMVMNFSNHKGKTVAWMARNEPGFLRWMDRQDFYEDAKAIARQALADAAVADAS